MPTVEADARPAPSCSSEHQHGSGPTTASGRWLPELAGLAAAGLTLTIAAGVASQLGLGPVDDAYISLRYAANWAGGAGLCFNPGEHVEGYTNFLMVLLEAAAIRCGAPPVAAMKVIGWASLAGLAGVFTFFISSHLFPRRGVISTIFGVTVCLNPMFICWAASGLETCLYALLVTLGVMLAVNANRKNRPVLSALCLILAALTRPEAVALLPVLVLVVYLRCGSIRPAIQHMCVFVVGFGVYFAARAWHFGYLFPNTFYAKVDYGSSLLIRRGAVYAWDVALAVPLLFVLSMVTLSLIRRAPLYVKAFAMAAGVQLLIVILEGGDHLAMFRFAVPVLPFLSVLAVYPVAYVIERFKLRRVRAGVVALLGVAAIGACNLVAGRQDKRDEPLPTTHLDRFIHESRCSRVWSMLGRWFRENSPTDASLATIAIGAIGYHSGLTIIDPHGLVDPVIAHQQRRLGEGYAGHEKFDTDYVLSKRPTYLLLANLLMKRPYRQHQLHPIVWGAFNKRMLENPRLAQEYVLRPIRIGRGFLNLHVRRDLQWAVKGRPAAR